MPQFTAADGASLFYTDTGHGIPLLCLPGLTRNGSDFDYLARLWDEIRENTLGSSAPALIHNDSDLIKRAIRDIYNRDIDEVIVEGDLLLVIERNPSAGEN